MLLSIGCQPYVYYACRIFQSFVDWSYVFLLLYDFFFFPKSLSQKCGPQQEVDNIFGLLRNYIFYSLALVLFFFNFNMYSFVF